MADTLGEKIRKLRKEHGYSLDKVAALTSSSRSYIWEVEQGRIPHPSAKKLKAIASALGVTATYLLDNEDDELKEDAVDRAFYRKYKKLPPDTKQKMRELINIWSK